MQFLNLSYAIRYEFRIKFESGDTAVKSFYNSYTVPVQLCIPMKNETVGMDFSFWSLRSVELLHTCTLICSLSDKHGVLILCSPIDMVNKVSSIMGVINSFPAKRKFVIWAFFGSFLLYPRQSRIQPMTCTGIMVCKKR